MEKPDYRAELSFCCSPLVVDALDDLIAKLRIRSRGELLREIVEFYLAKARINPAAIKQIHAHHDRLNMVRPRRSKRHSETDSGSEVDAACCLS